MGFGGHRSAWEKSGALVSEWGGHVNRQLGAMGWSGEEGKCGN